MSVVEDVGSWTRAAWVRRPLCDSMKSTTGRAGRRAGAVASMPPQEKIGVGVPILVLDDLQNA